MNRLTLWDEILNARVLCVQDIDLQSLKFDCRAYAESRYRASLDEHLEFTPAYEVPVWGDLIEFTYVMDFDREVFTMDNEVHFFFRKIPRSCWIKSLSLDDFGGRTPIPRLVPDNSLASLAIRNKMYDNLASINHMPVQYVNAKGAPDFSRHFRLGPMSFIYQIWQCFRQKLEEQMRYTLSRTLPKDFVFREIAFGIASFAAILSGAIRFEDNRRCKGPLHSDCKAFVCGESIEDPVVVASKLAYGYHKEGIEPGFAPRESTYWFRGILIHLTASAWDREAEAAIADAIQIGRITVPEPDSFDILLISIDYVIMVRVFADSIQRTKPLKLLYIPVHYSYHPEERYHEKEKAKILKWYEVQDDEVWIAGPNRRSNADEKELFQTFCAMVHLFESSVTSKLRPENGKEGIFPTELYEMILRYAVDIDAGTHRACSLVSRKFRRICLGSISLSDDVLLRGCSQTDPRRFHQKDASQPSNHTKFQVLSRPTGVIHTAKVFTGEYADRRWQYFTVLCGTYPRLSMLSSCYFFDFDAPDPRKGRHLSTINESVTKVFNPPSHDPALEGQQANTEHYWQEDSLKKYYKSLKKQELPYRSQRVSDMWDNILKFYGIDTRDKLCFGSDAFGIDWSFKTPANTRRIVVKAVGYSSVDDMNDKAKRLEQWTGYIRIKRPNRHDPLEKTWELARSEAEAEVMSGYNVIAR